MLAASTQHGNETSLKNKEVSCLTKSEPNQRMCPRTGWLRGATMSKAQILLVSQIFCRWYWFCFLAGSPLLQAGCFWQEVCILSHFCPANIHLSYWQVLSHIPLPQQITSKGHEVALRSSSILEAERISLPRGMCSTWGGGKQNFDSIRKEEHVSAGWQSVRFMLDC